MTKIGRVCVFCGSSPGNHPDYARAAREVGTLLARESIGLVFGGGHRGLMGEMADAALAAGGQVIGVIPRHLEAHELAHKGLSDLRIVRTMHERKAMMADLADGFVGLPGGLGTMEEFFEVATWSQLGIHAKPAVLLNVRGYYDLVGRFLDQAVSEGFLLREHRALIAICHESDTILDTLRSFTPSPEEKWLDRSER
jgi:uncharacterized protein (TIGR00730 family)